jgi:hypothetical protein
MVKKSSSDSDHLQVSYFLTNQMFMHDQQDGASIGKEWAKI